MIHYVNSNRGKTNIKINVEPVYVGYKFYNSSRLFKLWEKFETYVNWFYF